MKDVIAPTDPTPAGLTRRRALSIAAAWAAGTLARPGWPLPAPGWPLWVVEDRGGRVYLTGETPARATPWHDARIQGLVGQCGALWTETNQTRHDDVQALIRRDGMDTATPLLAKLGAADRERVAAAAALAKTPLDALATMRPWLAAFALEQAYYGEQNFPESGTAEKVLLPDAQRAGLALSSEFATQGDVIAFLGAMSPREDLQYLQYTLDHILDGTPANERVYEGWAHGDFSGAAAMVERMRTQQPELYKKHVIGRNQAWVPRIEAMLGDAKPALVVVGLYHAAGPDSVQAQLRARGLTVRAL